MKDRLLPLKQPVFHPLDPPLPLHVHVVRSIDHYLRDPWVLQEEFDRPEPDDLVGNLVDHSCQIPLREKRSAFPHQRQRLLANAESPLRARRRGQAARVDPLAELGPQLAPHLGEWIRAHGATRTMTGAP